MKPAYKVLALLLLVCCTKCVLATTYTLVASGNYTSKNTWAGGKVPPAILGADTLLLSPALSTFFLTLDVNLSLSALTKIDLVNTPITQSGKRYISMPAGHITSVLARIDIDSFFIGAAATFAFNGTLSAEKFTMSGANYNAGPNSKTEIKNLLHLTGSPSTISSLILYTPSGMPPPELQLKFTDGGGLSVSNPSQFQFSYAPHTIYYGCPNYATVPGAYNEHSAKAIRRIEIDTKGQTDILLKHNIYVQPTLMGDMPLLVLTSGVFDMNGFNFEGSLEDKGGSGVIAAHAGSALRLVGISTMHWDTLRFKAGHHWFAHFKAGKIVVDGDLTTDTLTLMDQGNLAIKNGTLNILAKNGINSTGASWIVTDSNATVKVRTDNSRASMPIGTYRNYMPATITNIPADTCRMYAVDGVRYGGTTGHLVPYRDCGVEGSWVMVDTFANIDVELGWNSTITHKDFDYQNCLLMRFDGTAWDRNTPLVSAAKTNDMAYVKRSSVPSGMFAIVNQSAFADITDAANSDRLISIHPNPAKHLLHVFSGHNTINKATVYNATGKSVKTLQLIPGANSIDISALAPGVYLISVEAERTNSNYRFIVLE